MPVSKPEVMRIGPDEKNTACSTCKKRKIACDRASPVCRNCHRSNRLCHRYHVRLSWPRANDRRRAILAHPSQVSFPKGKYTWFKFIDTSLKDVKMHAYLFENSGFHTQLVEYANSYVLAPPLSLSSHALRDFEVELVPYFLSTVLPFLPMFAIDLQSLRSMISRMAILDDSASSCAVLNSLLAWAAFVKYENAKQAAQFVGAALKSLRVSLQNGIRRQEALQHVLAGILICSLEMHMSPLSSPIWLLYLSGTKKIINQFYQDDASEDTDRILLFQWVFYVDTLAWLGMKHWYGRQSLRLQLSKELGLEKDGPQFDFYKITKYGGRANKIMELFSDFCYNMLSPDDPRYFSAEYISWLSNIENQLISIREQLRQRASHPPALNGGSESLAVRELFVLAVLVYFTKKSTKLIGASSKTNEWIESAFQILAETKYCNKPFPLFIFGLEARADSRRSLLLDVIDSTSEKFSGRGLVSVKKLLLKAWVQYDLHAGDDQRQERDICFFLGIWNLVPCLV